MTMSKEAVEDSTMVAKIKKVGSTIGFYNDGETLEEQREYLDKQSGNTYHYLLLASITSGLTSAATFFRHC